jgi:hypothetical protein
MGIIFDASPIENVGGSIGLRTFTHTFTGGAAALLFSGELQASVHRPINVKVGGVDLPLVAQDVQGTPARYGGVFAVASGVPAGLQTVEVLVRTTQDDQFCVAVDVHESDGHGLVIGAYGAGNGPSGALNLTLDSGAEDARALCVMAITMTQGALRADFTGLSGGMERIGIDHWFAEETATTVGPRTVGFLGNSIWAGAGMLWLDLGPPPSDFALSTMGALAGMSPGLSFVGGGLDVMLGACGAVAGMGRTLRLELPIDEQVALVNQHGMPGRTHGGTTAQALLRRVGDSPYWGDVVTSGGGGDVSLDVASVAGAYDIDRAVAATHRLTLTADATLTPVGTAAADETIDIRVELYPEGHAVAFGPSVIFATADGLAPLMPDPGNGIVLGFYSSDQGVTWVCFVGTGPSADALNPLSVAFDTNLGEPDDPHQIVISEHPVLPGQLLIGMDGEAQATVGWPVGFTMGGADAGAYGGYVGLRKNASDDAIYLQPEVDELSLYSWDEVLNAAGAVPPGVTLFAKGADPAAPSAGGWTVYAKSGGVYAKSAAGTVVGPFGAAGAPGGGGGYDEGTAFPGSPATGAKFYRTDVRGGMLFRFDGTRWVSDQLFRDPVTYPIQGATADVPLFASPMPTDLDIYVTDIDWTYYLGAAGATWVASVRRVLWDESSYPTLASVTVASGTYTNARWYTVRTPVNTVVVTTGGNSGTSTRAWSLLWDEQAGASGTYVGATVEYRLIAT